MRTTGRVMMLGLIAGLLIYIVMIAPEQILRLIGYAVICFAMMSLMIEGIEEEDYE